MFFSFPGPLKVRLTLLVMVMLLFSPENKSQVSRDYNIKNSLWTEINVSGSLNKHLALQFDFRYRRESGQSYYQPGANLYNLVQNPYQTMFRPWIHYFPAQKHGIKLSLSPVGFWATYGPAGLNGTRQSVGHNMNEDILEFPEFRTTGQIAFHQQVSRLSGNYLMRYELRWIGEGDVSRTAADKSGFDFLMHDKAGRGEIKQRIRMMYKTEAALKGMKIDVKESYLLFGEEIEIGLAEKNNQGLIDQNRLFIGWGYKFSETFKLEFGYLNQYIPRSDHWVSGSRHVLIDLNNAVQFNLQAENFQKHFKRKHKTTES